MNDYLSSPQGIQRTFGTLSQLSKQPMLQGSLGQYSNSLGGVGNAAGVVGGIQRGGLSGYGSAAINGGALAQRSGAFGGPKSGLNKGVGYGANVLGIYDGLKQGGVGGYGGAGVNAAQLGSKLGAFGNASSAIGNVAGYAAIPLSLYNEINNWESGNTGADALGGAATGAAIGSVVPGIGTAIGALIGGAGGAISSMFGNGRVDPENANFNAITGAFDQVSKQGQQQGASPDQIKKAQQNLMSQVQDPYLGLAGYFDLRGNQIKGNNPMYSQYGRMGEGQFTNDMVSQINQAAKNGTITNQDDASAIYNKVVNPWMSSWGKGQSTDSNKDAMQGMLTQMISQYAGGTAGQDWKARGGDSPFANIGKLQFSGTHDPTTLTAPTTQPQVQPQMQPQGMQPMPVGMNMMNRPIVRARGGAISRVTRPRFDDGGSVDFSSQPSYDPGSSIDFNSLYSGGSGNGMQDVFNTGLGDIQSGLDQTQLGINDGLYGLNQFDQQYGVGPNAPPKGGALSQLKSNATGSNGLAGLLKAYGPLIPLIQGAIQQGQTKKPTLPNGMSGAAGPMPMPGFNRQQVGAPGNAPAGGAVAAPTNAAGGAPMSQQDWYTYGERPEAQFYSNNKVPLVGQAKGGSTPPPLKNRGALGQATGVNEFNSAHTSHVPDDGTGDGTSDDVPAKLSAGEYVFDANTVSMLGNGSNKAGASRLDQLRQNLRKHAAKPMTKGKQFMKAKAPEAYMKGAK